MINNGNQKGLGATDSGLKPGGYPLGSVGIASGCKGNG